MKNREHFKKQNEMILKSIGAFGPEETYSCASDEEMKADNDFALYMKHGREICESAGVRDWEEAVSWGFENGIKLIELPEQWEQAHWNEISDWETERDAYNDGIERDIVVGHEKAIGNK